MIMLSFNIAVPDPMVGRSRCQQAIDVTEFTDRESARRFPLGEASLPALQL
jgi:hypothetical protein